MYYAHNIYNNDEIVYDALGVDLNGVLLFLFSFFLISSFFHSFISFRILESSSLMN